jgi:ATP-dependent helicase YprA (DUF1998 family)
MNIFSFRQQLIDDYAEYTRSFIQIRDDRIRQFVRSQLDAGSLWPEPLIQLNPAFEPGASIDELTRDGILHSECSRVFRIKPEPSGNGQPLRLHRHQTDAIHIARNGHPYVISGATPGETACFLASINSFVQDYQSRQKPSGIHLTFFIVEQLPILAAATYAQPCPWSGPDSLLPTPHSLSNWLLPRVWS